MHISGIENQVMNELPEGERQRRVENLGKHHIWISDKRGRVRKRDWEGIASSVGGKPEVYGVSQKRRRFKEWGNGHLCQVLWTAERGQDRRVFHGFAWVEVVLPLARALEQWFPRLKWSGLGVNGKWLSGDKMCKYCLLKIWFWRGVKGWGNSQRGWTAENEEEIVAAGEEKRTEGVKIFLGRSGWDPGCLWKVAGGGTLHLPHIVMKKDARGFRLRDFHCQASGHQLCRGGREGSSWEERRRRKEPVSRVVYWPRSWKKQMPRWE